METGSVHRPGKLGGGGRRYDEFLVKFDKSFDVKKFNRHLKYYFLMHSFSIINAFIIPY